MLERPDAGAYDGGSRSATAWRDDDAGWEDLFDDQKEARPPRSPEEVARLRGELGEAARRHPGRADLAAPGRPADPGAGAPRL